MESGLALGYEFGRFFWVDLVVNVHGFGHEKPTDY
jgi:hypothetical protein